MLSVKQACMHTHSDTHTHTHTYTHTLTHSHTLSHTIYTIYTFALCPSDSLSTHTDADDPDLDSLLADLCQLEEDTKAQLASATNAAESDKVQAGPPLRYVHVHMHASGTTCVK